MGNYRPAFRAVGQMQRCPYHLYMATGAPILRLPMHRMQGVLAVVPPLRTLFGKGTLVETNKTYEPTSSNGTGHDRGCSYTAHPSAGSYSSLRLAPISGRCYLAIANEEKREVLLPWGRSFAALRMTFLAVSRSLVRTSILSFEHVPIGTCCCGENPARGQPLFHPHGWKPGAFTMEER